MQASLRFESLCDKQYRPTTGDFVTRMALRVGISDLAETLPLNLCLLIDRSMSMTGAKMDAARQSAAALVEALRPDDRLSVLTFSSTVDVLLRAVTMDEAGKARALDVTGRLAPGGVTRMDLALNEAVAVLRETGNDALNMLLLLSDGAPTNQLGYVLEEDARDGLRDTVAQALRDASVVTSTIGLGDAADCLAPFLEACAETGQGVFYHEDQPEHLADRFIEAFQRVSLVAATDVRFHLKDPAGRVRKAAAVYPDLRELPVQQADDGSLVLEAGGLAKGEEHVFLVELVTEGDGTAVRKKLCDVSLTYRMDGEARETHAQSPVIEMTDDAALLRKPGHDEVEKYKAMYMAFQQTRFAADNVRGGGDSAKTRVLLESAAKTTRRLGMAKQTKLLTDMARDLDGKGTLSENQLAELTTAGRKTKLLQAH